MILHRSLCIAMALSSALANAAADEQPSPQKEAAALSPVEFVTSGDELYEDKKPVLVTFRVTSARFISIAEKGMPDRTELHLFCADYPDNPKKGAEFSAILVPRLQQELERIGIDDLAKHFINKDVTFHASVQVAVLLDANQDERTVFWAVVSTIEDIREVRSVKGAEPKQ